MDATPHCESLSGKRYIAYARCAAQQGAAQRSRQQIRRIRQFGGRTKMRCVDEVWLSGLNGQTPLLRWDLGSLLARKLNQGDFEVLVMEDPTRLTGGELTDHMKLEALFSLCGVQIIYVTTWYPVGMTMPHRHARAQRKLRCGSTRAGSKTGRAQRARSQ